MKKIMKSRIFLVIITMIICISGTLYAANTYKATDVVYNASDGNSMSVNDALNDIYNIKKLGTAISGDIASGKTAVVQGKLVTGTLNNNSGLNNVKTYTYNDYTHSPTYYEYDISSLTSEYQNKELWKNLFFVIKNYVAGYGSNEWVVSDTFTSATYDKSTGKLTINVPSIYQSIRTIYIYY